MFCLDDFIILVVWSLEHEIMLNMLFGLKKWVLRFHNNLFDATHIMFSNGIFVVVTMSQKFNFIKGINDSKEIWRLVVQIINAWSVINSKVIQHMEMLLMDVVV